MTMCAIFKENFMLRLASPFVICPLTKKSGITFVIQDQIGTSYIIRTQLHIISILQYLLYYPLQLVSECIMDFFQMRKEKMLYWELRPIFRPVSYLFRENLQILKIIQSLILQISFFLFTVMRMHLQRIFSGRKAM